MLGLIGRGHSKCLSLSVKVSALEAEHEPSSRHYVRRRNAGSTSSQEDQTRSKIAYEMIMVYLVQYDRSSHSVKSLS